MLLEIASRYNVDLKGVPAVGDSLRDLEAAQAVGATPILVLTGKGEKTRADPRFPADVQVFPDLAAVATALTA
jgi:D-glycero-D-manno-heptose 1,7-bisphosphate phosphatase